MRPTPLLLLPLLASTLPALAQDRRPLRVEDGDAWRALRAPTLSETGAWASYELRAADGRDGVLELVETRGERRLVVERGASGRFDFTERFAVALVEVGREASRAWKEAKQEDPKAAGEEPQSALAILDLTTGGRVDVPRVKSFALPDEAGGWLAYLAHEAPKDPAAAEGEEAAAEPEAEPEPAPEPEEKKAKDKQKEPGTDLVLHDLASRAERRFPNVASYAFSKDGTRLAFVTSTEDGDGDGVHLLDLGADEEPRALHTGAGESLALAFSEDSRQLAFLSNVDDYAAEEPRWTLYHARVEDAEARALVTDGTPGVPAGWGVSQHRPPSFSKSGARLLFGTAPLPDPEPEELPPEEQVTLDVWSWTDDRLQPEQLVQREADIERSYLAVAHLGLATPRVVQLGSLEVPNVQLPDEGDAALALGTSNLPYRHTRQWTTEVPTDLYRVEVATGRRDLVVEVAAGRASVSPEGHWAIWWDGGERQHFGVNLRAPGAPVCLTADIPHPLWNELHDDPSLPRSHGTGGWLTGDVGLLVYDRHDVWLVDPTGTAPVVCVTEGTGREQGWRFRRIDLDLEEPAVSPMEALLLSALHLEDRRAGFFRDRLIGGGAPEPILVGDEHFSTPVRARGGDVLRFTRESYLTFPDLWVADLELSDPRKLSDANPQQAGFLWGSAELVHWRSADGTPLSGILYRPEDFEADRRYPLVVYFYERMSDRLHRHHGPEPSRSFIRFPYYTSNGYCVFVPDIPYREGYPGPSCADAVLPGILSLIEAGFVDPDAIGVQGHSWGGYQIAYLVTQTRLFAAAISGAPVSNMTSAYGGIRWRSGMSRQWQYEKSQSRLGGSLWEVPNRYFENSPLFFADKVETPVLMLHNDQDGAVPWYQGIEFFVALKRLAKPVWLLNYNGEGHGLAKHAHRRDYAIRMSQFFDHYLRGAPAPVWMTEGVPAVKKGRTLGLEISGGVEGE